MFRQGTGGGHRHLLHDMYVRYEVLIEVTYLAGERPDPERVDDLLAAAIKRILEGASEMVTEHLSVTQRRSGVVAVHATVSGATASSLTSPLQAVTHVDTSLDRALLQTGLFEEFDVSRKVLHVSAQGR